MTRFAIVVVLAAAAGQTPVPAPQATFRGAVDLVRLDVSITRSGRPVRGLTARGISSPSTPKACAVKVGTS